MRTLTTTVRPRRHGFSLVEIVLVTAITAIVAAIAIPRVSNAISRQRVDGAARRLASDLQLAQRTARIGSASCSTTFTTTDGAATYVVDRQRTLDKSRSDYTVMLHDAPYEVTLVSLDLGGASALTFNGHGVPDRGAVVVLRAGLHQRTVRVDGSTGRVSIE